VTSVVTQYGTWLSKNSIAKLFISADPAAQLVGRQREFYRTWPNQRETSVKGIHFIQEDSAEEIGMAVASFDREAAED
jgi:haloalkane dehalogenase